MLYRYLRSQANCEVRQRSESGVITTSTGYDHADSARVHSACSSSPLTCSSPSFPLSLPASCLRQTHLRVSSCCCHRSRLCLRSCNRLPSPLAHTAPVFIFLTLAVLYMFSQSPRRLSSSVPYLPSLPSATLSRMLVRHINQHHTYAAALRLAHALTP
jgi:hypothetical protein